VLSSRHAPSYEEKNNIGGLKIKNAKPDDSGIYGISVKNPFGGDTSECEVIVIPSKPANQSLKGLKRPEFIIPLAPEVSIKDGQPIYLNCTVDGDPEPQVWNYNIKMNRNKLSNKLDIQF
jgi:hypothetical protein